MNVKISVGLVLYNSRVFLPGCLKSVFSQTFADFEVIAVDNNSMDYSADFVGQNFPRVKIMRNARNYGFSYAHNQAIAMSTGEFYLCINPDVILKDDYLEKILNAARMDGSIGIATGKIYRLDTDFVIKKDIRTIDSTGIYLTRNMRHFDRGSGEEDREQYDKPEYVFGATGACCLYRRRMLEDIKILGEYFDNDFFFSREDVDIAWRSQIMGWKTLYTPSAVSYHLRTVLPERRNVLPGEMNMHSVKNRYLLQIKNHTCRTYIETFPYALFREILIMTYVFFKERSSLKGISFVVRNFRKIAKKRKLIMKRKKVSDSYLAYWFGKRSITLNKNDG